MATETVEAMAKAMYAVARKHNLGWCAWEHMPFDSPNSAHHTWLKLAEAAERVRGNHVAELEAENTRIRILNAALAPWKERAEKAEAAMENEAIVTRDLRAERDTLRDYIDAHWHSTMDERDALSIDLKPFETWSGIVDAAILGGAIREYAAATGLKLADDFNAQLEAVRRVMAEPVAFSMGAIRREIDAGARLETTGVLHCDTCHSVIANIVGNLCPFCGAALANPDSVTEKAVLSAKTPTVDAAISDYADAMRNLQDMTNTKNALESERDAIEARTIERCAHPLL